MTMFGIGDYVRHTGSGEMAKVVFQTQDNCWVRLEYTPGEKEILPGTVRVWRWNEIEGCEYSAEDVESVLEKDADAAP